MRDAASYAITTDYGYIPGYPLNGGFHRGQDREMPVGTPVIVNGVQLGLSGNTGASTGPHLHVGRFVNGQATNPFGQGFALKQPAQVFDTGYDDDNGNFVRVTDGDDVVWVYLHLSAISVKVGQLIKGEEEPMFTEDNRRDFNLVEYGSDLGLHKEFVGMTFRDAWYKIKDSYGYRAEHFFNNGDFVNYVGRKPTKAETDEFQFGEDGVAVPGKGVPHKPAWYTLKSEGKV